jgi:phosphatidylglycerophosphate synthase
MALERRELKSRSTLWAKNSAHLLYKAHLSPNMVSVLSVVFAGLGAWAFYNAHAQPKYFFIAALFIQLRLFCNLMDGMLAIEYQKKSPLGDIYNDAPDRAADVLLILGAGLAAKGPWAIHLAWCVSLLAVATAYLRLLASSLGRPQGYLGPQAKQHRMFLLTVGAILSGFYNDTFSAYDMNILYGVLVIMLIGTKITCIRRLMRLAHALKA